MFKRLFSTLVRSPAVEQLENLHKLVQSVNNTPSTHQKRRLLAENPACHSILKRIYSPHVRHYISSKRALAYIHQHPTIGSTSYYTQLDQLLDALSSRTITGHEALKAVSAFYAAYCQTQPHQDIFWRVIDRNLKMGVSEQTVRHLLLHDNSSSKDFSPCQIKVALAHSLGKRKLKLDEADWYASQKLDGVRCISMIRFDPNQNTHNIQFLSRTGRPFYSLQKVELDLEKRLKEMEIKQDFVLDGEVCAYNAAGENEVFGVAVSQIRKMNETMKEPLYHIFDYIPMSVFLDGFGDVTFSQRQRYLETFVDNKDQSLKHINIVSQHKLKNSKELERMKEKAVENNWEGLILRRDAPYEGKRTNNLLKVKEWEDAEYIVNGVETNYMRMPDTGENKLVLKNVNIEHKGNIVSVGSGFSMNERIAFAENPSLIIGKAITVRYFSESVNKNGTISLRFPSIKAIYENIKSRWCFNKLSKRDQSVPVPADHKLKTWDADVVIQYIKTNLGNNQAITLTSLQQKTIILLCIATMARPRSEIGNIQYRDAQLEYDSQGTLLGARIYFRLPKETQLKLCTIGIVQDPSICPVFTPHRFLERTLTLTVELPVEHKLFLAYIEDTHKTCSAKEAAVANWVKDIMKQAGIDT